MIAKTQGARLSDLTLSQLLQAIASASPTPGGGAVSALAGALASALMSMVAGLTSSSGHIEGSAKSMDDLRQRADILQARFLDLADADVAAYDAVLAALRLPQGSAAGRVTREQAVRDALRGATEVPLAVADTCVETLALASQVAAHGKRSAAGDAAAGAVIAQAGLQAATRNARINLAHVRDAAYRETASARAAALLVAGQAALNEVLEAVDARG